MDASKWCWEYGASTGDARWCILSRIIERIAAPFEDSTGALSNEQVARIDRALHLHLPHIVNASTAADGASLARFLESDLQP